MSAPCRSRPGFWAAGMANDVCRHVEEYRQQGYAVVRGVFGTADLAPLSAAFDRHYAAGLKHPGSFRDGNALVRIRRDPQLGRIVPMVQWPSYADAVLAGFRTDRRLLDLLAPLIGTDIKQIVNQMHWKPPGAAAVTFAWHQDARFRRPRECYRNLGS